MTTPTKLEIDHAERFEALGLFEDAKQGILKSIEHGFEIVESSTYNLWPLSQIGPLPSCEEIWPVILEKCGDKIFPFAFAEYYLREAFIFSKDYNDLPRAMREACLTLFKTPQGE